MQWRNFEQGSMPENEVFMLAVGEQVFFAKIVNGRIVTKNGYTDAVNSDMTKPYAGAEVSVFLNRNKANGITPVWAHFHAPQSLK